MSQTHTIDFDGTISPPIPNALSVILTNKAITNEDANAMKAMVEALNSFGLLKGSAIVIMDCRSINFVHFELRTLKEWKDRVMGDWGPNGD